MSMRAVYVRIIVYSIMWIPYNNYIARTVLEKSLYTMLINDHKCLYSPYSDLSDDVLLFIHHDFA